MGLNTAISGNKEATSSPSHGLARRRLQTPWKIYATKTKFVTASSDVTSYDLVNLPTYRGNVAQLVEALRYKLEGCGFDSQNGVIGIFQLLKPSCRTMALWYLLGVKAAGV